MKSFISLITFILSNGTHSDTLSAYIKMAHGKATTWYGGGEWMCGDPGSPKQCVKGAVTASGAVFDPNVPSAALSVPTWLRMRPRVLGLKTAKSKCVITLLLDKKNFRYVSNRPWDITPALAKLLGIKGSANLYLCEVK